MEDLKGKVCIVTGAGKGIGRETAKLFQRHGANLALITRTLADFTDFSTSHSDNVLMESGDVSDPATVSSFIERVLEKFGRIDVLVNNAGMRFRRPVLGTSLDEWNLVLQNNLTSVFLFCQGAGQQMVEQRYGRIINLASIVGTLGLPELSAYGASKGGIITFSKCLALEWAPYNVNVNVIAPGFCETSYAGSFKENKPDLYQFTLDRTPQDRWGKSEEIGEACLFLASDKSSFITGETISIDGGWSAW
jgi:NAD(P)-dependent dehydrogenase (short-subunit alcohol dehydrogenase family)